MKNASANDIDLKVFDYLANFDITPFMDHFVKLPVGQKQEVMDTVERANKYYQWLYGLVKVVEPKQIIELGASVGTSTIMLALAKDKDCKLYTVDNGHDYIEGPKAWEAMNQDYPDTIKIWGDDLNLAIYPKGCKLEDTDILFIDTEHTGEQLKKELDLYVPLLKKGCVVVLDDIRLNYGMFKVWNDITQDKVENTNPCHHSGFGFFVC